MKPPAQSTANSGNTALVEQGIGASKLALGINLVLALVKIVAGIVGNSYALIADGIESSADLISSLVVWSGLRLAAKPADRDHPYGHGKAESIAGLVVASILLTAAGMIALESIHQIRTPHRSPAPFTLFVLLGVILIKEGLFRFVVSLGRSLDSTSLKGDAWHHRLDAITSAAVFIGISVALIGGPGYETADDWAALLACLIIAWNGAQFFASALNEVMDAAPPENVVNQIRAIASGVPEVRGIGKCRIRKSGLHLALDIHVFVNGDLSVSHGHTIAHAVEQRLFHAPYHIRDVTVHIEPSHK
ncbi:MAG TPA: cation diffusion facilitator family transporter [Verrucomicrobiae bacterium]|nr:cation diffusion facilitator family transporter [Verrucomicrobiae bacterium]